MCPKYSECSHVSVNFLRILAHMGVEARENQYNTTKVHTFYMPNPKGVRGENKKNINK